MPGCQPRLLSLGKAFERLSGYLLGLSPAKATLSTYGRHSSWKMQAQGGRRSAGRFRQCGEEDIMTKKLREQLIGALKLVS